MERHTSVPIMGTAIVALQKPAFAKATTEIVCATRLANAAAPTTMEIAATPNQQ